MKNFPTLLLGALFLLCGSARAQQQLHFATFENDMFFDTDRYYTNGIQLSRKHAGDTRGASARRLTGALCRWLACGDHSVLSSQVNLGQLMYTPNDITIAAPQLEDRHWGGLLYYEQIVTLLSPDQRTLTTFTGQIGVTGRAALAEPAQKLFHQVFDRSPPAGWDNQLGGSLGLLASAERRSARAALSFDLPGQVRLNTATYWRLAAGTIQTYAAGGIAVVIGKDLPAVSPPPPGIGNKLTDGYAQRSSIATACMVPWLQCTGFGAAEARLVAYNVFLDGRLFSDDRQVRRRNLVSDLMVGMRFDFPRTRSAHHGPWFVQFKVSRRSPEFRSSMPIPRHRVGALTIGTEF